MASVEVLNAGAVEQARMIRAGDLSAKQLVDATLARIDALDPSLNAFRVVLADSARAEAVQADARRAAGGDHPLLGVPVAIKDDVDVAGEVTAWGTDAFGPPQLIDSEVVTRLRAAGAIVIGKTNVPEMTLWRKIRSVGLTDVGRVREHNEDTIGVDADIGLFVLADGMGGYNAGEVASGIAVKTVMSLVKEAVEHQDMSSADPETGMARPSIVLRDAIARANKIIYQTAKTQPQCEGMGTTIVSCLFFDNRVAIAHVGDSRLYRLRANRFEQMTMDHSLLQELVDRGFYSQAEAQRATNKNYVTRALGVEPTVEVEVHEQPVQKGDFFVLCSDGLSDMVEDDDIHLTMSTFSASLETVAKQLIQLSNDNGGRDNVSIILAQVVDSFAAKTGVVDRILRWFG
jgi:protein phosphatase